MKALIQRVSSASVDVGGETIASIHTGLLVFLGVEKNDDEGKAQQLAHKVSHYRAFSDEAGRMALDLQQVGGSLLIVSQFTLAALTTQGLRPDFSGAAQAAQAEPLYQHFVDQCQATGIATSCGRFAAMMQVTLVNDGSVTFLLQV